jgi:capsular exopolysaccharide synthesis family protein
MRVEAARDPIWTLQQNKASMSYLFDALQRSQTERAEAQKNGSIATIELLEQSAREASAQLGSGAPVEQAAKAAEERRGPWFGGEGFGLGVSEADPMAIARTLEDEQRRETFSHFQALEISETRSSRLVCLAIADNPVTEAFHALGIRLRELQKERRIKRLLITSTVPDEGKSVVAANLASTLGSGAGQKVLLIDGDLRRSSQSELFGLARVPGLSTYLQGKRSLTACIYHLAEAGIWILPAGDDDAGSFLKLIQSPRLSELIETLNSWFDWIVIDTPPVLPMVDTTVWARQADGILLVTRPGTTRKRKLQKGLDALDPGQMIGVLLNGSTSAIDKDYYYYPTLTGTSGRPDCDGD